MNVQHAPRASTESREQYGYARVPGRWIVLARGLWITLVILTLAIFFASLPVYLAQLQTPCAGPACYYLRLTPEQGETLTGIGLSPGDYAASMVALTLATMAVCVVISTLIVWRRSHDRMALLVALLLVTGGPIIATTVVATSPSPWQIPNECLFFLANALLVLVFLLFPSGQFVPRWMRWTLVVFLAGLVPTAFVTPSMLYTPVDLLSSLLLLGEYATLALVQLYRYRRVSSLLQRQQTKWVVFGLAVPAMISVSWGVVALIFPALAERGSLYPLAFYVVNTCLPLFIPLSFGFAMLRYRLWDIDILINRTLVYGTLTVILTGVYVGLVIGLQALLRSIISQDSSVALVISTLAIATLFQPLRHHLQESIDRRFYRSKYDAAKIIAAFSTRLRSEVDLEQLREELLAAVQETMQPAHASLWVRPTEPARKDQTTGISSALLGEAAEKVS
jgi:hypothetical protein